MRINYPLVHETDRTLRSLSDRDDECLRLRADLAGVREAMKKCAGPGPAYDALCDAEKEYTAALDEEEALRESALAELHRRIAREKDPARLAVLNARYVGFRTYGEIAKQLGMSKSGVAYLLYTALMHIAEAEAAGDGGTTESGTAEEKIILNGGVQP